MGHNIFYGAGIAAFAISIRGLSLGRGVVIPFEQTKIKKVPISFGHLSIIIAINYFVWNFTACNLFHSPRVKSGTATGVLLCLADVADNSPMQDHSAASYTS
jgi:hypothetical protein